MLNVADREIFYSNRSGHEPIDAVYTWVDGSSIEFQHQVNLFAELYRKRNELDPRAVSPSRFADNECLRYSMRSIAAFAPWIRNIVIVTNGQSPAWLDVSHPRIRMVNHHDIFPDASVLPTFNSCAIEMNLDRISALSETFLYFNDDMLLGCPSERSDFFSRRGKIRVRFQEALANKDVAHPNRQQRAIAFCCELLDKTFGAKRNRHHFPHCPAMFSGAAFRQMEQLWPWHIDRTRTHRFRNERDCFVSLLHIHYLAESYETLFRDEDDDNEIEYLKGQGAAYVAFGSPNFDLETVLRSIEDERPRYFCINDEFGAHGPLEPHLESDLKAKLAAFLERYFPRKAEWEI